MLKPFRQILSLSAVRESAVPPGQRIYAIGDIHGRLDLFERMTRAIDADDKSAGSAESTVILLGDLIDRGPDSAGVVARARKWQTERKVRILKGNHEEMFLASFDNIRILEHFARFGGRETILSYGIDPKEYEKASFETLGQLLRDRVPAEERAFIDSFEDMIAIGDYLFVHAGIDPHLDLEQQAPRDLHWIREPFLSHQEQHSHIIVHGHTITDQVDVRPNRIGIDTGAYCSGRLTALVLEGCRRRFIEVLDRDGTIEVSKKGTSR